MNGALCPTSKLCHPGRRTKRQRSIADAQGSHRCGPFGGKEGCLTRAGFSGKAQEQGRAAQSGNAQSGREAERAKNHLLSMYLRRPHAATSNEL